MQYSSKQLLVIQHGTLIDGSGGPPSANDALVIDGNRICSTGPLPPDIRLDRDEVHSIDATGQWIMPGLIDGHCHLSFGFPHLEGVARAWHDQPRLHYPAGGA
jgi:imidazolonepropionase-like amidohydrolase